MAGTRVRSHYAATQLNARCADPRDPELSDSWEGPSQPARPSFPGQVATSTWSWLADLLEGVTLSSRTVQARTRRSDVVAITTVGTAGALTPVALRRQLAGLARLDGTTPYGSACRVRSTRLKLRPPSVSGVRHKQVRSFTSCTAGFLPTERCVRGQRHTPGWSNSIPGWTPSPRLRPLPESCPTAPGRSEEPQQRVQADEGG
jgi:hypothetical protein